MNTRMFRYTPLAAVLAIPSLGIAASDSTSASGVSATLQVTVTLNASVTGSLYLKVTGGGLSSSATTEIFNFGTVSPNAGTHSGGGSAKRSWYDDGTAYFIQPHAELFYTGYDSAQVDASITDFVSPPGATGDATAYLGCTGTASTIQGAGWASWGTTAAGPQAGTWPGALSGTGTQISRAAQTGIIATTACFSDSANPGDTLYSNIDVGMFLSDSAPTGSYSAKFQFTATVDGGS